jgi:hypothetical protein
MPAAARQPKRSLERAPDVKAATATRRSMKTQPIMS